MAIKANIFIDQGSTYNTQLSLTDADGDAINLADYTGAAQLRKHYTSNSAIDFEVSLSASLGTVTLSLTANATSQLSAGRYVYDVELTDSQGRISRIVEGIATVSPNVTR